MIYCVTLNQKNVMKKTTENKTAYFYSTQPEANQLHIPLSRKSIFSHMIANNISVNNKNNMNNKTVLIHLIVSMLFQITKRAQLKPNASRARAVCPFKSDEYKLCMYSIQPMSG